MGGLGSGNRYRLDKKDTVEGYDSLDVRSLERKGLLEPGCHGSCRSATTSRASRS